MTCQRLLHERSHQKSPEFYALSPFEMEENTCFAEQLSVCLPVVDFALKILVCYQSGSAWRAHAQRGEMVCLVAGLRTAALSVPESLHPTPCNWSAVGEVPGGRGGQLAT